MLVFAFMFVLLAIGVLVAIGVGVDKLVRFAFMLLAELLVAASPQAAPRAPSAKTAVSAIFFILLDVLLSSSKFKLSIYC
jgi:hypothetical protein